jgi:hypothetical protein
LLYRLKLRKACSHDEIVQLGRRTEAVFGLRRDLPRWAYLS